MAKMGNGTISWHRIRGVIFDLDGTLINTIDVYVKALNFGLELYGVEKIRKGQLGKYLDESISLNDILRHISPIFEDPSTNEKCKEIVVKRYVELEVDEVSLIQGADLVLQNIKELGLKTAVLSARTSMGEAKWRELRRLRIDRFVDIVITAAETKRKPDPHGVFRCLEELMLNRDEVVFVGDASADILAGKNAGVSTVGVLSGVGQRDVLSKLGPDLLVDSVLELMPYLKLIER